MKDLFEKQQFQKQVIDNLIVISKIMGYEFAKKALTGFKSFNKEQRELILKQVAEHGK